MITFLDLLRPRVLGLRNRWRRSSRAERSIIIGFGLISLLIWGGLFLGLGYMVNGLYQTEIIGPIIVRKLLEILLLGLFALLCFSNLVVALSSFYLSDDLELVLSLPVRRRTFHLARLAETIIQSSWMVAFFGLPIFTAYGYAYGAGWRYVLALVAVTPGFVLIPAGLGVLLASALARTIQPRKAREVLVLVGILTLAAAFVMLRVVRPERLANAESFESIAAYMAEIQAPSPMLAPPGWVSDVLIATLMDQPFPWLQLGLLLTGGMAVTGIARWVTTAVYDEGRARAQEARAARLARAGWLDWLLGFWTRPLPPVARTIVIKDVKSFVRDPSQWSQAFLVGSIVVITIASVWALPTDMIRGPWAVFSRNLFAYGAHALVGFIMAAVAARFQFTAVSSEKRGFWVIRTAPITAEQFLWAKIWPGLVPMIVVGEILALGTAIILGAGPFMIGVSAGTAICLAFAISGVAVGMGATFPNFKADDAARLAAGPEGLLFMMASLLVTLVVVLLETVPVLIVLRAEMDGRGLEIVEWLGIVLPLVLMVALCVGITVASIRIGARKLWERELPNS